MESTLQSAARHAAKARRFEDHALHKLETGRFGEVAKNDPWPRHDTALVEGDAFIAAQCWVWALEALLTDDDEKAAMWERTCTCPDACMKHGSGAWPR